MVLWFFTSPSFDKAVFESLRRREAMVGTLQSVVNGDLADRVVNLARDYGAVMQPGTITALAMSGHDQDPEFVRQVAARETEREIRENSAVANQGMRVKALKNLGYSDEQIRAADQQGIGSPMEPGGLLDTLRTPFKTQPEGAVEKVVSAPFRAATAPFRTGAFKTASRTAITAADMAFEELITAPLRVRLGVAAGADGKLPPPGMMSPMMTTPQQFERAAELMDRRGRSAGRIAIEEGLDLGEGFMPGGEAGALSMAERHGEEMLPGLMEEFEGDEEFQGRLEDAASQTILHNGKPLSMGRFYAGEVFEPDTRPYNLASGLIDASVLWFSDPASKALGATSRARKMKRDFGVVDGPRKGVDRDKIVDSFLTRDRRGKKLVEQLAENKDFEEIFLALGSNQRIPRQVVNELVDADTTLDVMNVLRRELGYGVPRRPPSRRAHEAEKWMRDHHMLPEKSRRLEDIRILADVPHNHVNVENLDQSIPHLRNYMINAKLPAEVRKKHLAAIARVDNNKPFLLDRELGQMYRSIDKHLSEEFGVKMNLTKRFHEQGNRFHHEARLYDIDQLGNTRKIPGVREQVFVNGEVKQLPTASTLADYSHLTHPLLDIREVRRAASRIGPLLDLPGINQVIDNADALMSIWKGYRLARVGWPIRVTVIDEQARMAASGLDSLYRHPIHWLSYVVGQKGNKLDPEDVGQLLSDSQEFMASMSRPNGRGMQWWVHGSVDARAVQSGNFAEFTKGASPRQEFLEAWSFNLQQLHTDPIMQRVAGGLSKSDMRGLGLADNIDPTDMTAVQEWFWSGRGAKFRRELAERRGADESSRFLSESDQARYGVETFEEALLTSRQFADDVIKQNYWERANIITGQNPELLRFIQTGRLGGQDIRQGRNKKFMKTLDNFFDSAPDTVKGATYLKPEQLGPGQRMGQSLDTAVKGMFDMLGSMPADNLSRSPMFRQSFWNHVEGYAIYMTPQQRADAILRARAAGEKDVAARIAKVGTNDGPRVSSNTPLTNWDDVEMIAKQRSLDDTRKLLYSLDKRSQFMDIARLIFPFGEAWKEIFQTWTRIVGQRPELPRRAQILFDGAKQSGIFYDDPVTDELMFGYQIGGVLADVLGMEEGTGMQLEGRVQDLNLFTGGGFYPGTSPVIGWPTARIVPHHPDWNWFTDAMFPFGRQDATSPGEFLDDEFLTPWMRDLFNAMSKGEIDERGWANTVADLQKALVLSGRYDRNELDEALEEATGKGQLLFFIRSGVKLFAPSSVTVKFTAEDKSGNWATFQVLANRYSQMLEEADYDTDVATQQFIDRYDLDPILISQGRTTTVKHRALEATGAEWEQRNPEFVAEFDRVAGLFAPVTEDDDFDFEAYWRAQEDGAMHQLDEKQQIKMANHIDASMQFRHIRNEVIAEFGNTQEARDALKQIRALFRAEYPGFDTITEEIPSGAQTQDVIEELYEAVNHPVAQETEAGQALAMYLEARDGIMEIVHSRGFRTLQGSNVEDLRFALDQIGSLILSEHPEFANMWHRVLSREVNLPGDDRDELESEVG